MAPVRQPATLQSYVLHRYDWSESSLILDLFTREQGRLAVAAKGAKRPYSQLRAVLLPFQQVHVTLSRPRRGAADDAAPPEVQNLRGAGADESFRWPLWAGPRRRRPPCCTATTGARRG